MTNGTPVGFRLTGGYRPDIALINHYAADAGDVPDSGLTGGRLNITLRVSGLT